MHRVPNSVKWSLACLGVAMVGLGLAVVWRQNPLRPTPSVAVNPPNIADNPCIEPAARSSPLPADDVLRMRRREARTEQELIAALDAYAGSDDAMWDSPLLADIAVANDSALVRRKAFAVAFNLARTTGRTAEIDTLRGAIANPHADVRKDGLRACRDHPHYDLLVDLLDIVGRGGPERSIAVEALAFLDDPEAQLVVLDTARSEEVSRAERIQAVVLLSRTDLDEGVEYLQDLAAGEDQDLRRFAAEALATRRKAKR